MSDTHWMLLGAAGLLVGAVALAGPVLGLATTADWTCAVAETVGGAVVAACGLALVGVLVGEVEL